MTELEEIKSKLDIVEVVQGYIPLKQSGRNFKAPCPFHSEKSPSFMVSPEKQIFHCFGCNEGGDVIGFVMKIEGLDFYSTLKILADKAGVKLEEKVSPEFQKNKDKKTKLFEINEIAADYYENKLWAKESEKVLKYLINRGLSKETIKDFRLGYAPKSRSDLTLSLEKKGFKAEEILSSGLAKKRDEKVLDFFWERIIFPIADHSGSVVGFTGRVLDNALPKYINTPETEIYHKSSVIYGMDKAKDYIRKGDHAILVEGNMDVIASHQAGVKNTVAVSGTAFTETQLKLIGRFSKNLKLSFDVDNAGNMATKRAIEMAQKEGFNIKVIEIPEGKDAADVVKKDKNIWLEACKNAKYVVDYIFEKSLNKNNKETVLGKKAIARELLTEISKLPDKIEQDHYLKMLSKELNVEFKTLKEALKVPDGKQNLEVKSSPKNGIKRTINIEGALEERLTALGISYPEYKNYILRNIKSEYIKDDNLREIFLSFTKKDKEQDDLKQKIDILQLKIENELHDFTSERIGEEVFFSVKRLREIRLKEKRTELAKKLETDTADKGKVLETLKELDELIKEQIT